MILQTSSLLTAVAMSCVAMSLTLAVSWLANRQDTFLLTWSFAAALLVIGSVSYGIYADNPDRLPAVVGTVFVLWGFVLCWSAARQFRCGEVPARETLALACVMVALQVPFHLADLVGTMLILMNLASAVLLVITATEYWRARVQNLRSLRWLTLLYVLEAVSFVCCAWMLVLNFPFELHRAPQNWAETFNTLASAVAVTAIGGLSLALNQERLARVHMVEARTDALTGLLNRRAFDDLAARVPLRGNRSIIVFDLDLFKALNDRHGHAFGDVVLRHFAHVCASSLRKQDVAARVGGEEFCVVLEDCPVERALVVANRIRLRFAKRKIYCENEKISCTVSAGVCGVPSGEAVSFETLYAAADTALYAAKENGRNRVCRFEHEMEAA